MTTAEVSKVISTCKTLGIKEYRFSDDINVHFYNNDSSSIVVLQDNMLWNITKTRPQETWANGAVKIVGNNTNDIRNATVTGSYKQIIEFAEAMGITLDDDQKEIIVNIDRHNNYVNDKSQAITGDYSVIYHKLSPEEIAALPVDKQEEYKAKVAADEKRFGLGTGTAAQITV